MKKKKSTFASNIAMRRRKLGMNQVDFARRAGIGVTTLREIETDVSGGWPETRQAIASALGCALDDLYATESKTDPAVTEAIDRIEKAISNRADGLPLSNEVLRALKTASRSQIDAAETALRAILGLPDIEIEAHRALPQENRKKERSGS